MAVDVNKVATSPSAGGSSASVDRNDDAASPRAPAASAPAGPGGEAFPVGSVFIAVVSTNPATLLGYGTWAAFAAGRMLVGLDAGDGDFDAAEETGGSKNVTPTGTNSAPAFTGSVVDSQLVSAGTPAGSVSAPTISGSTADEGAHTHSVTSNVAVANHTDHTHSVTSNVTVADHASHTHTYTQVPNHVHVQRLQGGTTGSTTGTNLMGSTATGGSLRSSAQSTLDPTGGVATGTTNGPGTTLTHTVTNNAVTSGNPGAPLTHSVTNNAVTSGAGSNHSHGAGTLAASAPTFTGSAMADHKHTVTAAGSVSAPAFTGDSQSNMPPYIVVYMWKRTA